MAAVGWPTPNKKMFSYPWDKYNAYMIKSWADAVSVAAASGLAFGFLHFGSSGRTIQIADAIWKSLSG